MKHRPTSTSCAASNINQFSPHISSSTGNEASLSSWHLSLHCVVGSGCCIYVDTGWSIQGYIYASFLLLLVSKVFLCVLFLVWFLSDVGRSVGVCFSQSELVVPDLV